jgi:uncharacterized protein (DUF305 family)
MMKSPYLMFALNVVLSGIAMYFAMFTMIDGWDDFRINANTLYMTLTMLAPMAVIMLATMPGMYENRRANVAIVIAGCVILAGSLFATRTQTLIGDDQFIASMIPHHSGAILMCRQAQLSDQELKQLCAGIEAGQRKEIDQMKAIDARLHPKH